MKRFITFQRWSSLRSSQPDLGMRWRKMNSHGNKFHENSSQVSTRNFMHQRIFEFLRFHNSSKHPTSPMLEVSSPASLKTEISLNS